MADNKVADAYVEVGAKMDKLEKDLKKTEDKVEKSLGKAGKKAGNALESPIVSAALKATAAFGTLELGLGGVNVAADALTGNIEDAAEGVKRLPAGIGPFATQLETLLGKVTGIRKEIEHIEQVTAALESANAIRMASAEAMYASRIANAQAVLDIEREIELLQASPEDRPDIAISQQESKSLDAAIAERDKAIKDAKDALESFQKTDVHSKARERADEIREEIKALRERQEAHEKWASRLESGEYGQTDRAAERAAQRREYALEIEREIASARSEINRVMSASVAAEQALAKATEQAAENYDRSVKAIKDRAKAQKEESDRLKADSGATELMAATSNAAADVESLRQQADIAEATDPLERERIMAEQRLAEREKQARRINETDQALAERFREQSERIYQAELSDIERREREKAQAERDAKVRERAKTLDEEIRMIEVDFREKARAEEQMSREMEREQREAINLQRQIDSTSARVRSISGRNLRPGDVGFGSKAGTAGFEKPQKIESKTLDDIKILLERNLALATGGFA